MSALPKKERDRAYRQIEALLDAGLGECWLRDQLCAAIVQDSLLHFDGLRYDLAAWVVMPNHVHALAQMRPGFSLPTVVKAWKTFTANSINKLVGRSGPVWQRDYFDRYIRDADHLTAVIRYIDSNPVKAGLAEHPLDWRFSSAMRHCNEWKQ